MKTIVKSMKTIVISMKSASCGKIDAVFKISKELHSEIVNLKKEFHEAMLADVYDAERVSEIDARLNEKLDAISLQQLGAKRLKVERFHLDNYA